MPNTINPLGNASNALSQALDQVSNPSQETVNQLDLVFQNTLSNPEIDIKNINFYKLGAIRAEGIDDPTLSSLERDILNSSDQDLLTKYGYDQGAILVYQKNLGYRQYLADKNTPRTAENIAADTVTAIGSGLGQAAIGIAALPHALNPIDSLSRPALEGLNALSEDLQDWTKDAYSTGMLNQQRAFQQVRDIHSNINEQTSSNFLERVGKDFVDTVVDYATDPTMALDVSAQMAGSTLTGGPLSVGIRTGATKLGQVLGQRAVQKTLAKEAGERIAQQATRIGEIAAWPLAVGLQEGGGGYLQGYQSVQDVPTADLYAQSPVFGSIVQEYKNQGMNQTDAENQARYELSTRVGSAAGLAGGLAGIAMGQFTKGVENVLLNPLQRQTARQMGVNSVSEALEEAVTGGSAQIAQNISTRENVNREQSLAEGVGEQLALGALGGASSVAGLQIPGAIVGAGVNSIQRNMERARLEREQANPLSPLNIQQTIAQLDQNSPNREQFVGSEGSSITQPTETQSEASNEVTEDISKANLYKQNAMQRLVTINQHINREDLSQEAKQQLLEAGIAIAHNMRTVASNGSIEEQNIAQSILQSEEMNNILQLVQQYQSNQSADTLEGRKSLAVMASVDLANLNIQEAEKVINNQNQENLGLSNEELSILRSAVSIAKQGLNLTQSINSQGLQKTGDNIFRTVRIRRQKELPAIYTMISRTASAIREGNTSMIQTQLNNLKEFAQERINKANAYQAALNTNTIQEYPSRDPYSNNWYVRTIDPQFIKNKDYPKLLKQEAEFVNNAYNEMIKLNSIINSGSKQQIQPVQQVQATQQVQNQEQQTTQTTQTASKQPENQLNVLKNSVLFTNRDLDQLQKIIDNKESLPRATRSNGSVNRNMFVLDSNSPEAKLINRLVSPNHRVLEDKKAPKYNDKKQVIGYYHIANFRNSKDSKSVFITRDMLNELQKEINAIRKNIQQTSQQQVKQQKVKPVVKQEINKQEIKTEVKEEKIEPKKEEVITSTEQLLESNKNLSVVKIDATSLQKQATEDNKDIAINKNKNYLGLVTDKFIIQDNKINTLSSSTNLINTVIQQINEDNSLSKQDKKYLSSLVRVAYSLVNNVETTIQNQLKKEKYSQNSVYLAKLFNKEGKLPSRIKEIITLATVQYLNDKLIAGSGSNDVEAIVENFDIDPATLFSKDLDLLSKGLYFSGETDTLGSLIQDYLGARTKEDTLPADGEFIFKQLAQGLITELSKQNNSILTLAKTSKNPITHKSYTVLLVNRGNIPYIKQLDVINKFVLNEQTQSGFSTKAFTAEQLSKTQDHTHLPLSKESQQEILTESTRPYKRNRLMDKFFSMLGSEGIIRLLSRPLTENTEYQGKPLYAQRYLATLKGRNRSYEAGIEALELLRNAIDDSNTVYFENGLTKVNRLQERFAQGPRGNKIVREVYSPIEWTADLSDPDGQDMDRFNRAMYQALDIHRPKIENISQDIINNVMNDFMAEFQTTEAAKVINKFLDNIDNDNFKLTNAEIKTLHDFFIDHGADLAPVQFTALIEYQRYVRATFEERKNFICHLAIEIDGNTNGQCNQGMLYGTGYFSLDWILSKMREGIFFFSKKSMQELRQMNGLDNSGLKANKDTYESLAQKGSEEIIQLHNELLTKKFNSESIKNLTENQVRALKNSPVKVTDIQEALLNLMVLFDVQKDSKDGNWNPNPGKGFVLGRSFVKRPITKVNYGSGNHSLGITFIMNILEIFNERSTLALQRLALNPNLSVARAFFPKAESEIDAQRQLNALNKVLTIVTKYQVGRGSLNLNKAYSAKHFGYSIQGNKHKASIVLRDGLTPQQMSTFINNMEALFINPFMVGVRNDVPNAEVYDNVRLVSASHQVMSIFHSKVTQYIYDKYLKQRATETGIPAKAGLSRKEIKNLNKILLNQLSPVISSKGIFLNTEKTKRGSLTAFNNVVEYAGSTQDSTILLPASSGVAAQPLTTIAMGDGTMQQKLANYEIIIQNNDIRTTHDGVDIPPNKLDQYGSIVNQAATEAWRHNPDIATFFTLARVYNLIKAEDFREEFEPFFNQALIDLKDKLLNNKSLTVEDKDLLSLVRNVLPNISLWDKNQAVPNYQNIVRGTEGLMLQLFNNGVSVEARHRVFQLDNVLSCDQMAGVEQPYMKGNSSTEETTEINSLYDIQSALNTLYEKELDSLKQSKWYKNILARLNKAGVEQFIDIEADLQSIIKANEPTPSIRDANKVLEENAKQETLASKGHELSLSKLQEQFTQNTEHFFGKFIQKLFISAGNDLKVIVGSREYILNQLANTPSYGSVTANNFKGIYDASSHTIYLVDLGNNTFDPSTFMHELTHAATYWCCAYPEALNDYEKNAYNNIKASLERFVKLDSTLLSDKEKTLQNVLNSLLDQGYLANALTEYIAYGLTDPDIKKAFQERRLSVLNKVKRGLYKLVKEFKKMIFGRLHTEIKDMSVLKHLAFNTNYLIIEGNTKARQFRTNIIAEARTKGLSNSTIEATLLNTCMVVPLDQSIVSNADIKVSQRLKTRFKQEAGLMLTASKANGFLNNNPAAEQAFLDSYILCSVGSRVKPDLLLPITRAFTTMVNEVDYSSFLINKETEDMATIALAQQKADFLKGIDPSNKDALAVLFALSQSDAQVQRIFNEIPVKQVIRTGTTLNDRIDNLGNQLYQWFTDRYNSTTNTRNVATLLDATKAALYETAQYNESMIQHFTQPIGRVVLATNDLLAEYIQLAGSAGYKNLNKLAEVLKKRDHDFLGSLAHVVSIIPGMFSKGDKDKVAEAIYQTMNVHTPKWLFNIISPVMNDILGRTETTAGISILVKQAKNQVQRIRNQFINGVPKALKEQFSKELSENTWSMLYRTVAKTDLVSLNRNAAQLASLLSNKENILNEIKKQKETLVFEVGSTRANIWFQEAEKLARYMNTGKSEHNLRRNADAIMTTANVYDYKKKTYIPLSSSFDRTKSRTVLDQLITLMALDQLSEQELQNTADLLATEQKGMEAVLGTLQNNRQEDINQAQTNLIVRLNRLKGYIPSKKLDGVSLQVFDDKDYVKLTSMGYVRVGDYASQEGEYVGKKGYYFASIPLKGVFSEGVLQTVKPSAGGVTNAAGYMVNNVGGHLPANDYLVEAYNATRTSNLIPVYDVEGNIKGFERNIDPDLINSYLKPSTNLADMLGVWAGREIEELKANTINQQVIKELGRIWKQRYKTNTQSNSFINLFDEKNLDPVIKEAISLIPPEVREMILQEFGMDGFMVRKDMVDTVIGYRNASIGDLWSDTNRLNPKVQQVLRTFAESILGKKAMMRLLKLERGVFATTAFLRNNIVVRSYVIPYLNIMSNVLHLLSRGISLTEILDGIKRFTLQSETYVRYEKAITEAQIAQRMVSPSSTVYRNYEATIQRLQESINKLEIAPVLRAGEFSTIADLGSTEEDLMLTQGKWGDWLEAQLDKVPSGLKTAAKYAVISKDTSAYKFAEKATQYGDFVAKCILYRNLINKGVDEKTAINRIGEEFVDYDRLPGRTRNFLENWGFVWFMSYKIRTMKIALSILRENPLTALLAGTIPFTDSFDTPLTANAASSFFTGSWDYTTGFDSFWNMLTQGIMLNPLMNTADNIL